MAATSGQNAPPVVRRNSPSPESSPSKAMKQNPRVVSNDSTTSRGSSTDGSYRDSLASPSLSRQSSASYGNPNPNPKANRASMQSFMDRPVRRGYTRPEGTEFAASAKHRESVLSLGSIAHLQYYFARTGLLEGKGGQLARKRNPRATLDLSSVDSSSYLNPGSEGDSSYPSLSSSPDYNNGHSMAGGPMVESPTDEQSGYDSDDIEDVDPNVLPPTVSTYKHREKVIPKPPTMEELKAELNSTLDAASRVLKQSMSPAPSQPTSPVPPIPSRSPTPSNPPNPQNPKQGWDQVQGMQILDTMTLAIRAAKNFYTSHEQPEMLDTIRSEKEIRADLLAVMETLKHMATRNFVGGPRVDERTTMTSWIEGIRDMLKKEEEIEEAERVERQGWAWLRGDWTGREIERELAFLRSMEPDDEPLPAYTPAVQAAELPTPFLEALQNGVRLVKLHNATVRKSKRRFGTIGSYHVDTQKPYRCADNLRYWIKAAELRWEVMLKVDVLGVVYNTSGDVWVEFEEALWKWCRKTREEITAELVASD
ncbi:hypothetical protein PG993_001986 [Apiospora rasikravindrae]|uniref:Uncharacterized protein n=1 Tax=Apiospora rasikravindrae TaxID=990691 RepID=A0ABR1UCZ2_9PEZI